MGLLVDGKWTDRGYDAKASGGKFVRAQAQWRDWVTPDGRPAQGVRAASRRSPVATTSMSRSPARGRTGR